MRVFILTILSAFSLFLNAAEKYQDIPNQANIPILTPSLKDRKVEKIKLENGLEAILVSDPQSDQSGAAIVVRAGNWQDPEEYPGIAHFLEHMLFLGTKKYPQESGYQKFIAENGGTTNAFTTNDFTSFMFSVNNDAFEEGLDRFANFFKEPLFNPSGVARELHAIDNEYGKNVENDDIRQLYVMKELNNPKHPNHGFGMGNSSTLSKVSQQTLIDWYKNHYSSNLMRLIVYSPLPLDKLRALVINDFSDIPNKNYQLFNTDIPLTTDANEDKMIYIEPVKDLYSITLVWYLPGKFAELRETQPESLVCYILGHEGEGSLLEQLKDEQLVEGLKCGGGKLGPNAMAFYIDIELLPEGLAHIDKVIKKVYQAIAMLKETGIPQYVFDDLHQIEKNKYMYEPRENIFETVVKDAGRMPYEKLETYPEQSLIIQRFDPAAAKELIDFLTPKNAQYYVIAPPSLTGIQPDHKEKWIGVNYAVRDIPPRTLDDWEHAKPDPKIKLPGKNPLIPANLAIQNTIQSKQNADEAIPLPETKLILDDAKGKVYFAGDNYFGVPKIYWWFEIKTPQIRANNPRNSVLGDLYVKVLLDNLNKFSYNATMAGIDFDIKPTENGIGILISGYSDKASLLLKEILKELTQVDVDEDSFKIYVDSLLRQYQNASKESPVQQGIDLLKSVVHKNFSSNEQKAAAIRKLNLENFNDFLALLFKKTYVEGLLYGNMNESQAKELTQEVLTSLNSAPYPKSKQLKPLIIVLPKNKGPFFLEDRKHVMGNALILAVEYPDYSFKARAAQQILMQGIGQPFFQELRTKQQTGYIVDSTDEELTRKLFSLFFIQSNSHDANDLLARTEIFIENYMQELGKSQLTEDKFNATRTSLLNILKHSYSNPKAMGELLKTLAFKYDGDFTWMNKRFKGLEEITYTEFLNTAQLLLGRQNKERLAILIQGNISEDNALNYHRVDSANQLRRLSTYDGEKWDEDVE